LSVEVYHEIDGPADGEIVVLSNSIGSNLHMWDPQIGPLTSAGYRVVRYDIRGHGRSPVPDGPYTLADVGGDLTALLDDLGVDRAHIVGLSLGGMTGMWLGAHRPERVRSLVLCCTSALLGPPEMWVERARQVRAEGTESIADGGLTRWVTQAWREANPERAKVLRDMMVSTPDEGYAGVCAVIEKMDQTGDLASITAPTLVISGAEDPATPPEHGERIAAGIPGARFEVVPNAAHLGNYEQPEKFSELIIDHLEGRSR
jgi:3-oxoadipate enol-lactonase